MIFWAIAALVGFGMGTAAADERISAYGERHDLIALGELLSNQGTVVGQLESSCQVAADMPDTPVFNGDMVSAYGELNEVADISETQFTLAGNEDLNAILPPTAAGPNHNKACEETSRRSARAAG